MSLLPRDIDNFLKDFAKILSISDKQAKKIENFIVDTGILQPTENELENLILDKDLSVEFIDNIFDVIDYLYARSYRLKFDNQKIIEELKHLCVKKNINNFEEKEEFIKKITSKIEKATKNLHDSTLYKIGASYLKGFYYFVDLRTVEIDDKIELLPVINVELLLDNLSDEEKSINIQFNERNFNKFFENINDLKSELEKVKDYLNKK